MAKHPDLIKKLQLLYSVRANPEICSNTDLARSLGITKQAISRWLHGSETTLGDHIPLNKLNILAAKFQISEHWFALPFIEFKELLFAKLQQESEIQSIQPSKISISLLPTTNSKVFGRNAEIKMLNAAFKNPRNNIVQIFGFGGVGKSCLTNYWLSLLSMQYYYGAKRVYAWSFYWQGSSSENKSSGDFFVEHALEWFGDSDPNEGTHWAKATRLANLIREEKTLLILDGLEPLQYPPGPKSGFVENPAVALLIRELATKIDGVCVIASRLPISDLAPYKDDRVKSIELGHLEAGDAMKLLEDMGVDGDAAILKDAVQLYSCHPLSLSLLAGYLKVVHNGEAQHYRRIGSLFEEQSQGAHARNLMQAYLDWFRDSPECEILYLLGMINRTTTLRELQSIVDLEEIDELTTKLQQITHAEWSYAIKRLCEASLITISKKGKTSFLDCHPLIMDFVSDQLARNRKDLWVEGNRLLFQYLTNLDIEDSLDMKNLEPLFRAVVHGAQAGLYEEAFNIYFNKIKRHQFSLFTSGSHHADQACIRAFFVEDYVLPVEELAEDSKHYLYSCASANLIYLGHIQEAIKPARISIDWFSKHKKWAEAAGASAPLTSMLIASGELGEAQQLVNKMKPVIKKSDNLVISSASLAFQAFIHCLSGEIDKARVLFEKSDKELIKLVPSSPVFFPTISSYYCKFLLDTGEPQAALERCLKTFAWRDRKAWQVAYDTTSLYASDLLVLGLTFLALGDWINAKIFLDKQVDLFKSANEWLYLPTGLHSRAQYFIARKQYDAAEADLNEALSISTRTGAKFSEWETYLNLANLYYKKKTPKLCNENFKRAKSLPGMNMYRFRDHEIAEIDSYLESVEASEGENTGETLNPT